ncbi:DUF3021 domain-containing protein [bacterium 1XD42-8]|nr:DUF3021 domain-containing protein [bacterium 1XD42-8]
MDMRKMFGLLVKGISASLSLFSTSIMILDVYGGTELLFAHGFYTKMFIGAIIVGIGFSAPGFVYENENMPYVMRAWIHMGVGCTIFVITGLFVGWIPRGNNPWVGIGVLVIGILAALFLWFCFCWHYKQEAKNINEKIKKINEEKDREHRESI